MYNEEIGKLLGITDEHTSSGSGIVIFYQPNYKTKTITEIGRTQELNLTAALDTYAETPNPASQLLCWASPEEKLKVMEQHKKDIVNSKWLDELFECI